DARGDYYGAAENFAKAISQRPDYARAWLNQASALLAIRQLGRAEASARRAIQLDPQWSDAQFVLGNIPTAAHKPGALEAYRQAEVEPLQERFGPRPHARRQGSVRVGFLSAGFGDHPTALLIVELIERLRESSLHTLGYATTADDGGPLRKRLSAAFHEFHDL